ncbi:MAG: GntR family transcriptional regulator [Alicyclobacillus macrosporangiidus]|uniref:GntR family transcriptional regulator n=1 Tax=Alicyclobacillus macrosporangiidus TaxID=392015 RepID=UPI0026EE4898|nr:GntR family transcriptional regulator [Alicyclobacillus macrosporangiidus]MCL6600236.1 GntR family transcriptional regulator [Alicyclobacillus macrosporangiidus]
MNRLPLYVKVHQHLLNLIEKGVYKEGEQLPPETELAKELNVSLITIRRAMQELAISGYVTRQPGRGTFVTKPNRIDQPVSALTSFTADMQAQGIVPSSTVLAQEVVPATEREASALSVEVGEDLFHLRRVRNGDNTPLLIESVYVPLSVCPGLIDRDFQIGSLYQALTDAGIRLTKSTQVFEPIILSDEESALLRVPKGSPAFLRQATSFQDDTPIEWVESIYRKDRFRFVVETGKYSPRLLLAKGDSP